MLIKEITLAGEINDVVVRRTERGALIITNDVEIEVERRGEREERWGTARNMAAVVYGTGRRGNPNASSSMIHEILQLIERVAEC